MEIYGKGLVELKKLLDKGEISKEELDKYFRERIKKHDEKIGAFVTVAPENYNEGRSTTGKLAGLPLAVKDNYCTKDLRTTASSKVLDKFVPPYDSTVTSLMKKEGISILGKTNMDAWAHGSSGETSDYGSTKNPWNLEYAPGGSSSGSAAAVAAYLAPAALGSETAGSIRIPASWCGIIGFAPTYGRVSRYGIAPMGSSLDRPSPLTTTVADAALMLEVMAGVDPYDATSIDAKVENYTEEMKNCKKFTIGVPEEYFEGADEDVRKYVEEGIKVMESLGHKIKMIKLLSPDYSISDYTIIQRAEVSSNLARYHGIRYSQPRSEFGKEAKKRAMLGAYTLAHGYYDAYYKKALKVRTLITEDFKTAFKDVDLIAGPIAPSTAIKLGESEKYPFFGELMDKLNEPSAMAGLPSVAVPVGVDRNGLPIGMQFIGNHLQEVDLFDAAYQLEQETDFFGVIKKGLDKWK